MRFKSAACLLVLAALAGQASAQWREWDAEFDEEKKGWKEIQARIPVYPKAGSLVLVKTGSATSHRFYVDTSSISVGEDEVVRFTVVTKTSGGATNVTFEGMRCETRERKLYALGHADGTWVRARNTDWQRVVLRDLTPYHHTLYTQYFCLERSRPTPVRIAIDALKQGRGLNPGSTTE
jgi:hypothetical protein